MLRKMADRYFFDKRDWKRRFIKYGIIFGISFLPIVLFNIYCSRFFDKRWLLIFVDSVILLVLVVIGNYFANKIYDKKDAELEKRQKERKILQEKKKKIMEDSYKKIREEKANKKASKQNVKDEIVVDSTDDDINNVDKKKTTKETKTTKTANKNTKGRK